MRISVLITCFNYARYVGEAIDSAVNQTFAPIDIVVVDDGSTDGSRAVIEQQAEYHGGQVRSIFNPNGGQADAINVGFAHCTGDIIAMLDADDLFHRTKLERVVQAFAERPRASMVQHPLSIIGPDGESRSMNTGSLPEGDLVQLMVKTGGAWMASPTSGLSFRRSTLEQTLPIASNDWKLCADGALAYSAALLGEVATIPVFLGTYRLHGNNGHFGSTKPSTQLFAELEMSNRYINAFAKRIGRDEKIDLRNNLSYRRERFYHGQTRGWREAVSIAAIIWRWPFFTPLQRARALARFSVKAIWVRSQPREFNWSREVPKP